MKRRFSLIIILFCAFFVQSLHAQDKPIKNIILMIPDGTSSSVLSLSRWYQNGQALAVDPYLCGFVKTHSSDAPIGDSAPTGSAYATGHLSKTRFISTYPNFSENNLMKMDKFDAYQPLFTILEASKLLDKATGLVATSYFTHATPAAFAAHHPSRSEYEIIAKQMVYNNIDVLFAGGTNYIKNRNDKTDLSKTLQANQTFYADNITDFRAFKGQKIWALFSKFALANDIDRNPDQEPSIAEMTEKAIDILSKNKNGFFLMVEGSKVDWSAHDNDPIGVITEYLAFDRAVAKAIEFAKINGETAVIVLPDHGNGGISLGNNKSNKGYDKFSEKELFENLRKAKKTAEHFGIHYKSAPNEKEISDYFKENFGINNLIQDEIKAIIAFYQYEELQNHGKNKKNPTEINKIIANIINSRNFVGWTTSGHTGEDVFLAIYHPTQYRPMGLVQNTDINKYMCQLFQIQSLDSLTKLYYVPSKKLFEQYKTQIDSSNVSEPILIVYSKNAEIRIPANRNEVWYTKKPNKNRQIIPLKTIVVFNGIDFYVPKYLLELL
jgi:alkaline phosphatase